MKSSDAVVKDAHALERNAIYEFAGVRLDMSRHALEREGKPIELYPRAFDALMLLLEHRNELLSKATLMERLWPNQLVEENSLARLISDLRKALGPASSHIVTVARRGYRLAGDVRVTHRALAPVAGTGCKTLAVLPFSSVGAADRDRLLAFGLADALITRLSHLREIVVRPTSSVARYADGAISPAQAGRELRVDAVLCGSVRGSQHQVRVTVQLIDVAAEATLWAEKFDEALADLFDIEDSISERVAEALAGELTGQERRSLATRYTSDSEAYESYLRGRFYLSQRTGESLRKATECFERAVQLDAGFALAHAGIAEACVLAAIPTNLDPAPPREMVPLARAAVERALAIDERLSQAHAVLGQIAISFEWNWPAAQASFRRAIQLNPNNANAHSFYSIALGIVGDLETALQEVKLARELEPTQIVYRANVGFVLYRARRFAEAVVELRTCVALEPASAYVRYRYGLALEAVGRYEDAFSQFEAMSVLPNAQVQALVGKSYVLAVTGRAQEARGLLAQLLVIAAERYVSAYYIAEVHAGLGEIDAAMSALERAFEERAVPMISLHSNPRFDVMRAEPRFVELLRRVGLWNT